jgi:hypothetical protein
LSSRRRPWLLLLPVLALVACEAERDPASLFAPGGVDVPVVDALLVVDEPLPVVILSRTQPPDRPYDILEAAIDDAQVRLVVAGTDTVRYGDASPGGRYWPPATAPIVQPGTVYQLLVTTDRGERLSAATTTPARIEVQDWILVAGQGNPEDRRLRTFAELGDAVYDAPENQLVYAMGILEARLAADTALGYQLALASLDPGSDYVIDPPFFDEEDFESLDRVGSSPVLETTGGAIRLPWFAVYFEGRYFYEVLALDRNAYDLVRSTPQGGFGIGGNAGDNFERPIYNVEGGIGLFGSAAVDSVGFRVLPAP